MPYRTIIPQIIVIKFTLKWVWTNQDFNSTTARDLEGERVGDVHICDN